MAEELRLSELASQLLSLPDQLERLENRVNSIAGQVDQIRTVQERLSNRLGALQEQLRIAEAHFEHQVIVSARLSRRLQEIERNSQ